MSKLRDAVPVRTGLWAAHSDGKLRLLGSRCVACGELFFPRKNNGGCTHCQAGALEPVELGPYGRIDSFSAALQAPAGGFYRGPVPYAYGLVDLDEGLRVMTRLAGAHTALKCGQRVELVIEDLFVDEGGHTVQGFGFSIFDAERGDA